MVTWTNKCTHFLLVQNNSPLAFQVALPVLHLWCFRRDASLLLGTIHPWISRSTAQCCFRQDRGLYVLPTASGRLDFLTRIKRGFFQPIESALKNFLIQLYVSRHFPRKVPEASSHNFSNLLKSLNS